MKTFKFEETNIYDLLLPDISQHNHSVRYENYLLIVKAVFEGIAEWMQKAKTTKNPIGVAVTDLRGDTIMISYCKYLEPSEDQDETAGSWLIDFSFNPEDMPENAKVLDVKDSIIYTFVNTALSKWDFKIASLEIFSAFTISLISRIIMFLDVNVTDDEPISLVHEYFTASAAVENGKKVMGITVEEEIKNIVKGEGDEALSNEKLKATV